MPRRRTIAALAASAAALTAAVPAAQAFVTHTVSATWHTESYAGSPNLFWVNGGTLDLGAAKTSATQAAFTLTVGADVTMLQDRTPSEQPVREDVYACTVQGCALQASRKVTVKYPGNITRYRYEDTWKGTLRSTSAAALTGMQVKLVDARNGSQLANMSTSLD